MAHRPDLDKRILHAYDLDARQSLSSLARKLGPSRDIIARKISEFEKNGTITGYLTVIDIGLLGFTAYAVYARLETASDKKRADLLAFLNNYSAVYWVAELGGRFDILFAIQARSMSQFSQILGTIQLKFPFIIGTQFAARIRATQFQRSYLVDRISKRIQGGFEIKESSLQLTQRELNLIKLLVLDPHMPINDIAAKLRITRVTATTMLKRLEKVGVIQGYSALISCRKLQYESYLLLLTLKRFDNKTRHALRTFAANEPTIIFCIETIGEWHTEFHCEIESGEQLQMLARKIRASFPQAITALDIVPAFNYYYKYRLSAEI